MIKNEVLADDKGELRAKNYQVVSAPCRHPSGNYYEVINDVPIDSIFSDDLLKLIEPYRRKDIAVPGTTTGTDTSRSGLEFRKILALLKVGKSRERIYKIMEAYSKWSSSSEQYRTTTFENAENYYLTEEEEKSQEKEKKKRKFSEKELKEVYNKIKNVLKKFMDLGEDYYSLITVWIMGTYFHKNFPSYPYLFFNAMKGSGKTRILKIISNLSFNGKLAGSMTESVMFRKAKERTLCIDEFENVGSKEKSDLRLLLNSAYKRGVVVERAKKNKEGGYDVEEFEVYCPIALANIWGMENVLSDRCVTIILEKSDKIGITKLIENFEEDPIFHKIKEELSEIDIGSFKDIYKEWNLYIERVTSVCSGSSVYSVISDKTTNDTNDSMPLKNIYKAINSTNLQGRDLELFFPLFIVSQLIGKEIFKKTLETSKEVVKNRKESDREENKDVQLIEFVSGYQSTNFVNVSNLTQEFKGYLETSEDWLNSTWVGKALRRLALVRDKRRLGKHRQVQLDIEKAKEKLKMFKEVEPKIEVEKIK